MIWRYQYKRGKKEVTARETKGYVLQGELKTKKQ